LFDLHPRFPQRKHLGNVFFQNLAIRMELHLKKAPAQYAIIFTEVARNLLSCFHVETTLKFAQYGERVAEVMSASFGFLALNRRDALRKSSASCS